MRRAWIESNPGLAGGHEEGGFITLEQSGAFRVSRWPTGAAAEIVVPPHAGCRFDDRPIVASFHTHPNSGHGFRQEPSTMDRWAIRDDEQLKAPEFIGEFVISKDAIYLVDQRAVVSMIGQTGSILQSEE